MRHFFVLKKPEDLQVALGDDCGLQLFNLFFANNALGEVVIYSHVGRHQKFYGNQILGSDVVHIELKLVVLVYLFHLALLAVGHIT